MARRLTDTTVMMFVATVLITLSHLDAFLPNMRIGGGAFGNSLFFFLSGYGLTMSLNATDAAPSTPLLLAYLRKRLTRLYPSVFIVTLALLLTGQAHIVNMVDIFEFFIWPTPFWFISAIVVFYIPIFYLARLQPINLLRIILSLVIPYIYFYSHLDLSKFVVEGDDYFKWINYFGITLLGCWVARRQIKPKASLIAIASLAISFLLFVAAKLTVFKFGVGYMQFIFHALLYPFAYFSFHVLSSESTVMRIRNIPIFHTIALIAGMTLEIYLTQMAWIPWLEIQKYNLGYPVLLIFALIPILVFSLLTKWLSNRMNETLSRLMPNAFT